MKILLDTHILIWLLKGDKKIASERIRQIEDRNNELFVSIASFWEITIKASIGKLELYKSITEVSSFCHFLGMKILEISLTDLEILGKLEFHHNDPFDRILISTAINQDLLLMTNDEKFDQYPIKII